MQVVNLVECRELLNIIDGLRAQVLFGNKAEALKAAMTVAWALTRQPDLAKEAPIERPRLQR